MVDREAFARHFSINCYKPLPELEPFIAHTWVLRWALPPGASYRPTEILSGPHVNLFFTYNKAWIQGIMTGRFTYTAKAQGAIAGVKFRPSGFYPFWRRPLTELTEQKPTAKELFPEASNTFSRRLIQETDSTIIAQLDQLLLAHLPPAPDPHVELINYIIDLVEADPMRYTVNSLARELDKSERTLQFIFQKYVGVGIKWVLMRQRLLAVVERMTGEGHINWATLAAELGYSSQAHFISDFTHVIGESPVRYSKRQAAAKATVDATIRADYHKRNGQNGRKSGT